MTDDFVLTTPVIFAIFNNPDTTAKVFERIRKARPPKLFIYADGSREDKIGEAEACNKCREIVSDSKIDWDCEVHRNFADKNMGLKSRMVSGISWAFEHVEEAIILEDDCLPSMSFFRFCQELLEKYRYDMRVTSISGSHNDMEICKESYVFSNRFRCWGWATWKRSWERFDPDMKFFEECKKENLLKSLIPAQRYIEYMNTLQTYCGKNSTSWSIPFAFSMMMNHGLCIIPKINMIRNIGFWENATHTKNIFDKNAFYMDDEMEFPLTHPKFMMPAMRFRNEDSFVRQSDEETAIEFEKRKSEFQKFLREKNYSAVFDYFKDVLRNAKVFKITYVYYLAYAYLMTEDYEHAFDLIEILLKAERFPANLFIEFSEELFEKNQSEEGCKVLNTILEMNVTVDEVAREKIYRLAEKYNVELAALK